MEESRDQAPRESTAAVFGIAVGLALLLGSATFLFKKGPLQTAADPMEALARVFQTPEAWPEGLQPTAAADLANGEGWIRWGGVEKSAPPEPVEITGGEDLTVPVAEPTGKASGSSRKKVDWVAVDSVREGSSPDEVFLLTRPRSRAKSLRDAYFRNLPRKGVEDLKSKGGRVIIETGEVLWLGYEASTVHERKYFKQDGEPTFRDSIRVNLSLHEPCVLIALWPMQSAARMETLKPLLETLVPLDRSAE